MHGVINLLKPPGMTSHDAVAFVRLVCGTRRVGHTGTLDPAAAGVLPICVGLATRLVEDLQVGTKEYRAEATFGYETDSCDVTGETVREADASPLDLETLRHALDGFRGEIEQTPPMHSAIKVGGRRLYELARAGEEIEIPTRRVTISRLFPVRFEAGTRPQTMIHIECSGGTYIRSLVRDIGRATGSAATMTFLVRTRSGGFYLREACSLEELQSDPAGNIVPLLEALSWCAHSVIVDDEAVLNLAQGKRVTTATKSTALQEHKTDSFAYKMRVTRVLHNQAERALTLFRASDGALAVLARATSEDPSVYQPEKVFDLRAAA